MTTDITYIIGDILRRETPELESRIGYQTEALRENECINPLIGQWIDGNDVKYLLSALILEDEDFAEVFPAIAYVKKRERRELVKAIELHFDHCKHCSLKRGYDLEFDSKIKKTCLQNKDFLLQLLEDDADLSEGEHRVKDTRENEIDSSQGEDIIMTAHI